MADLRLYLLGPPRVELEERALEVKPRKALALLIYLALTAEHQARDTLATLFWPNSSQRRARKSLRSRLSELNLALGDGWIEADRERVGLRAGFWLDVTEFQAQLAHRADDPQALIAAVDLYRDDFLTGFTLLDCPQFDEWHFFQSESLRQTLATTLARLANLLGARADYAAAILYARRRLALDPLHEPAHRHLMQLYAQSGQPAAALRQYARCRQSLHHELGVAPSPETESLHAQIEQGAPPSRSEPAPPRPTLPIQTTLFIGRARELADLERLLLDEPGCRLLNLVGPGGIGKTRLALAAAEQMRTAFADGVYFVSLASVDDVADIVSAMAEALRFGFYGSARPKDQLLDFLGQKQVLLVIDNFEHLLADVPLLAELLRRAPEVTLLVTSRARLNLQEEWVYDLQGLTFPAQQEVYAPDERAPDECSNVMQRYPAVQLFLQRARQADAGFVPTLDEMSEIGRICQLVEGMPLALELAAPWIKVLRCREIAAEIERNLDFLTTPLHNVPQRHRSLRVVFEQTWTRLSTAEQTLLMRLSVLRGGCTRAAAEQVAGATLPILSLLVDKALVRRTDRGRYELHELIRQFAELQLESDPRIADQTRQRHRTFFINFLAVRTAGVKGRRQLETLAEIEADIDNVRLAWRGAVANRHTEAIEQAAECLFVYYLYRNGYDEGQTEFRRAIAALAIPPDAQPDVQLDAKIEVQIEAQIENVIDEMWLQKVAGPDVPKQKKSLLGFLLAGLGYFLAHRRNLQKGQIVLEQALALLRSSASGDRRREGFALLWLGWAYHFQGQLNAGKQHARESLHLFTQSADHWGKGWALLLWANCLRDGHPAQAASVYQTGLTCCLEHGDQFVLSYLSLNMGNVGNELGRYAQAQQNIDRAVAFSARMQNILGLSYALLSRGRLEISRGKYRQAIQTLQQALTYFNSVGAVHASRAQIYLGLAHHLQGDYARAAQWYAHARAGLKAANSQLELTRCLNGLGRLAYDQGKFHQAEQLQRESLRLLQATALEPALVAATLHYLGQVMVALGAQRHMEARHCFRQALELTIEHQLAPIALDLCVDVALLRAEEGETADALGALTLVAEHEASTYHTRQKADGLRAEWVKRFPSAAIQLCQEQKRTLELWATAQQLLVRLNRAHG